MISGNHPPLFLSEGLALLTPRLREHIVIRLQVRHGARWWARCLEIQSDPVRDHYRSEAEVRTNADPAFWLKVLDYYWDDCRGRWGAAERLAVSNLRRYRNLLSHDTSQLSARDIHEALRAVGLVMQAVAPAYVPEVEALTLSFRIEHPEAVI